MITRLDAERQKESFRSLIEMIASYGLFGTAGLILDAIHTKARFSGARLVRRPAYVRGGRWIRLGQQFTSGRGLRMEAFGHLDQKTPLIRIGNNVQVNDYVHIAAVESVSIGDRVLIASRVFITDHNHGIYSGGELHTDPRISPAQRALSSAPVVIEEDVWIGESVSILPGVRIGKGAVIGTMSTVTRDVPEFSIAAGTPAKVVKQFSFDSCCWERV